MMNVLIADTNPEVLRALSLLLEQKTQFLLVGESRDAVNLFAQITRHCPDIVILDANLHGLQTSRRLSPNPLAELVETLRLLCPSIQVIALSSQPNVEKEWKQADVDFFACKSDPPEVLFSILDNIYKEKNPKT